MLTWSSDLPKRKQKDKMKWPALVYVALSRETEADCVAFFWLPHSRSLQLSLLPLMSGSSWSPNSDSLLRVVLACEHHQTVQRTMWRVCWAGTALASPDLFFKPEKSNCVLIKNLGEDQWDDSVAATSPDDLSSAPKIHMVEGEGQLLWPLHTQTNE